MNTYKLRRAVQNVTLVIGVVLFIVFALGFIADVVHTHCPMSAVCFGLFNLHPDVQEPIFPLFTIGGFAVTIPLLLLALTALTLFTGRLFCGWICPIGTLQEKLYLLTHKGEKRFRQCVPYGVHRWLKWLKYMLLLTVAALAFFGLHRWYMGFCPVHALAHAVRITWMGALTLVVIVVVGGFIVERFWCRYLCPYAALLNLFMHLGNWFKVPRLKVHRNIDTSLGCKNCRNYCPMHINIECRNVIDDAECIQCQRCVRRCTKTKDGKEKCLYCE